MAAVQEEEDQTFFVEALFPFTGTDASSLSFNRGDIIQVLNQLPSGWWDGLLDDERGWFPSNYVRAITDAEAEEMFARRELDRQREEQMQMQMAHQAHGHPHQQQPHPGAAAAAGSAQQVVDPSTHRSHGSAYPHPNLQTQSEYWEDRTRPTQDYWIPKVTESGQIYYVNSVTGQQSRDLPMDDTAHESHLPRDAHHNGAVAQPSLPHINTNVSHAHVNNGATMGYSTVPTNTRSRSGTTTSQASSSRGETVGNRLGSNMVGSYGSSGLNSAIASANQGGGGVGGANGPIPAGFGVYHRSETPEPWVKRLTDDGQAYYYYNPVTEEASWARPEPTLDGYQSGGQGQGSHGYGGANVTNSVGAGSRSGQQQQQPPPSVQQGSQPHQGDLYNHQNSSQTQFQPRPGATRLGGARDRAGSETSYSGRERDNRRASVYSDDSEVSPLGKDSRPAILHHNTDPGLTQLSTSTNTTTAANVRPWPTPGGKPGEATAALQATGIANPLQVALALQSEMAPPSLPPLTIYSDKAGEAISAVVEAFSGATDATKANGAATNGMNGDPAQPQSAVSPTTTLVDGLNDRTSTETARVQTMADRVALVVVAVRNLLYVSGTLTGSLPNLGSTALTNHAGGGGLNSVGAGLNEDVDWVRQEIKPYQRKVTATLSKLVLSARAVNSNPDWPGGRAGAGGRVESDAAELQRAVTTFVYQIQRTAASSRAKRLQGVMVPGEGSAGIGPGLIGAGVAGGWKGAGFVPVGDSTLGGTGGPEIRLGREVVSELAGLKLAAEEKMNSLRMAIEKYKAASTANLPRGEYDTRAADLVILNGRLVIGHITDFLLHAEDVHIATAVDVMGTDGDDDTYLAGVKRARELIRTFETAKQALYDDGAVLLMTSQAIHVSSFGTLSSTSPSSMKPGGPVDVLLQTAIPAIQSNLGTVMEALELLLNIAHEQDEVNAGREPTIGQAAARYDDDVEYPHHPEHYARLLQKQRERQPQYGQDPWYPGGPGYSRDANAVLEQMGIPHPDIDDGGYYPEGDGDRDMVSMTDALGGTSRPPGRQHVFGERDPSMATTGSSASNATLSVADSATIVGPNGSSVADTAEDDKQLSDDSEFELKKKKAPASEEKLKKLLGAAPPAPYKEQQKMNQLPAYLRLDHHGPTEIVLNPDGGVRAGTLPALIERLTMHSGSDARFNETFMMTFKSFATIDQVFDMLVERYNIKPPEDLTPEQLQEWTTAKKTLIRLRVLNTMRKLIDVLEKEDLNILDRVKAFASEVVAADGDKAIGAKTLLQIVQRVEKNGIESKRTMHTTTSDFPPPSILPRRGGPKLKLLDIDPLELARQLTIMESELFFKIKQSECIARSKESTPSGPDNIKTVITLANRMADWVADAVLSKEDPRRRAAVIKHFINVAEKCRSLANHSSMAALIAGLNCPPIRRLKRTWEQVNMRSTAVLDDLEKTLDTAHNFQGYKALISGLQPPCVPFLGVYLTVLTFIQDGAKDTLKEGGLINFQKRQKTADVIQEITKFQMQPYNLTKLPVIRNFIEESLANMETVADFWQLSLEREPREREDEKMARLLQESGFL
ncbi:hypothetical protein CPB86DRAFT_65440 [Serendipita vermifera]|nr:hypothetical protein CPB86DRAFT_65440 [Serendipita vermifera]